MKEGKNEKRQRNNVIVEKCKSNIPEPREYWIFKSNVVTIRWASGINNLFSSSNQWKIYNGVMINKNETKKTKRKQQNIVRNRACGTAKS